MTSQIVTLEAGKNPKFQLSLETTTQTQDGHHYRLVVQGSDNERGLPIKNWPGNISTTWQHSANPYYRPIERLINIHLSNKREGGRFDQPPKAGPARLEQEFCVDPVIKVSNEDKRNFLRAVGKLFA